MAQHRKPVRTNGRLKVAMQVTASAVTLNSAFVAAVKAAYVSGRMQDQTINRIIPSVANALHAHQASLPLPNDVRELHAAIDAALGYLEGRNQITIPAGELVAA